MLRAVAVAIPVAIAFLTQTDLIEYNAEDLDARVLQLFFGPDYLGAFRNAALHHQNRAAAAFAAAAHNLFPTGWVAALCGYLRCTDREKSMEIGKISRRPMSITSDSKTIAQSE